ncbi:MAG: DUF3861 domain-containing protein [Burkholderiaceae bacterium]|nr:DUF3861 domain-containing protein [Burkholderiaceae bacterium]
MKQHRYRVTLEHLADAQGAPSTYESPLVFEVGNHDDIFQIVQRMRTRDDFDESSAAALAVGLKLFSEVMLEHKDHPLFASFKPHFSQFMKELKGKR